MSKMVFQNAITVIAPIKKGQLEPLRELLNQIGEDVHNNPYIPFYHISTIHYCRFFIIDDVIDSRGNPMVPSLVFASNFDGGIVAHLNQWIAEAKDGMDYIFSHCEGYNQALSQENRGRRNYLLKYRQRESLWWTGKMGYTVEQIRQESLLYHAIQQFIDDLAREENLEQMEGKEVYARIVEYVKKSKLISWAITPPPSIPFWRRVKRTIIPILHVAVSLATLPIWLLPVLLWGGVLLLLELLQLADDQTIKVKPLGDILKHEDRFLQNQLTMYAALKSPNGFRRRTIRMIFAYLRAVSTYWMKDVQLNGIETIHFARFVEFNGGKNMMFLSNFDGSWENYMDELIDRAATPLNFGLSNMKGYPKTISLTTDGAHDEPLFKRIARNYQGACEVWFSAYPELSLKNIVNNAEIRKGLSASLKGSAIHAWLQRF